MLSTSQPVFSRRPQYHLAVGQEPLDVEVGVNPAVSAGVCVGRACEPQIDDADGSAGSHSAQSPQV